MPLRYAVSRRAKRVASDAPFRVRSEGFTLLEILCGLAIIGLLAAVLIGGAANLLAEKPQSAEDVFWEAVRESRKNALKSEHEMRLRYDKDKKQFVLVDGMAPKRLGADGVTQEESVAKVFPVNPALAGDLQVNFLAAGKTGRTELLAGVLVEVDPVSYVSFYEDGTCSGFRVQFVRSRGTNTLAIDRWTCAPVLEAKEGEL